jgi:putative FmdB family regulatory protein
MPLYDYECRRCGEVFEVRQKFADEPLTTHEGCGGAVHRLLSPPALQFKGSGWYITDYARGGNKGGSGSTGNGAGSSTSSESKPSTDSKPASTNTDSKPS